MPSENIIQMARGKKAFIDLYKLEVHQIGLFPIRSEPDIAG